jgi:hypothetical protein
MMRRNWPLSNEVLKTRIKKLKAYSDQYAASGDFGRAADFLEAVNIGYAEIERRNGVAAHAFSFSNPTPEKMAKMRQATGARDYTKDDEAMILACDGSDQALRDIAEKLGRSFEAIEGKWGRLKAGTQPKRSKRL